MLCLCALLQDFKGAKNYVQAQLTMEAVESNSVACLEAGTCQPLGGFNVWAAMPPLPINANTRQQQRSGLPVTLVIAGIDTSERC